MPVGRLSIHRLTAFQTPSPNGNLSASSSIHPDPNGAGMTIATTPTGARELDYRAADGIEVALLWHTNGDFLSVVVSDARIGETFELVLDDRDNAMDVFNHPYAHAAHRGLEFNLVSREEELVSA
jgi:hypothetical protein